MKTKNIFLRLNMLFFTMMVVSCAQPTRDVQPFTGTPTFQENNAVPVVTDTSNASPTMTMFPTLPVEEARKRLLDLLSNNGDCHLPCLLSITPGATTYQEAQAILIPFSILSDSTGFLPQGGVVSPNYVDGDLILATNIGFNIDDSIDNQIVSRVGFQARELKKIVTFDNDQGFDLIFDSKVFDERLNYYMLHNILAIYGRPETVMIGTVEHIHPREPSGGFHILLLYPEQGIMVEYTTQMHTHGPYVSGCPANAHVEMDLYPPGDAESFYATLEKTGGDDWTVKKNWYKPLEETTSMSIDEFYETFREPTDKCIETLASLFPIPDP